MKNKLFILIPTAVVLLVALCVGAVFVTSYLRSDQQDDAPPETTQAEEAPEEYVYPEEISIDSPTLGEGIIAKLQEAPSTKGATAKYMSDKSYFRILEGKLVGEMRLGLSTQVKDTRDFITLDEAREIACDFFADEEDFDEYTLTDEGVGSGNLYQFEFHKTYGKNNDLKGSACYLIKLRRDGEIFSWRTPGPGMDDFDPASVADLTVDDVYAYCDEQIDGEFEIDHMMIEKYDGIFKIGCRCLIDEGRDFVVIRYPIG